METLNTVDSFELSDLPVPQQFFRLAYAYLDAAIVLNLRMLNTPDKLTYARGCVPLYLARHSVELFLKGAILSRSPSDGLHHDVEGLGTRYHDLYQHECFRWDVPFCSEPISLDPEALRELKKSALQPSDQMFRYPTNKNSEPWKGISGYVPLQFHMTLETIKSDFDRLEQLVLAPKQAKADQQ